MAFESLTTFVEDGAQNILDTVFAVESHYYIEEFVFNSIDDFIETIMSLADDYHVEVIFWAVVAGGFFVVLVKLRPKGSKPH